MSSAGLLVAATAAALMPVPSTPAPAATVTSDPCAALESVIRQADPILGGGVTVSTGREGNLFPRGTAPGLLVAGLAAPGETLRLTVRDRFSATVTSIDTPAVDGAVALPNRPGWFKVAVERRVGGVAVGATCLWYGVAAAGTHLDLGTLPPGKDWGGPGAVRDVLLHAQLGLPVVRRGVDVGAFVANPVGDPALAAGASLASKLRLRFVVQVGQGGAAENAAVADGTWGALVRRIVAANPAVRYWEAWNEPNTPPFFTGTPAAYVRRVLTPFAVAVRAASPSARVVGGSALGDDPHFWTRFGKLGGFRLVDVIGVHPYTWGWGAPETEGLLSVLQSVRTLARRYGGRGKPIFDTESAWPSAWQGTGATIGKQADYDARKIVIERALRVKSGQFLIEGGWQGWDVIDVFRGVKPAALALATTTSVLGRRRFLGWWKTGVRGVYAARFRGRTVVWSVAGTRTIALNCGVSGEDAYGARVTARWSLSVTGSPVFLLGGTKRAAGCVKGVRSRSP